jgi:hypothetical protein
VSRKQSFTNCETLSRRNRGLADVLEGSLVKARQWAEAELNPDLFARCRPASTG